MRNQALLISASVASIFIATPTLGQTTIVPIDYRLPANSTASQSTGDVRPAGNDQQTAAAPATLGLTLNVSASVEDRALFLDQGFTATDRLTGVITASLSKDGSSLGIFRRQPLTNNRCDGETDVEAIHQRPVGPVTVEVKVAYISICGPDALDFRLTASRDLGNGFTASVRGEIIRDTGGDGFNDDVLRGRLDYSRRLGQGFTANASVQVAYSSFAGGVSIGGSGGLSREIGNGLSVNATASGYCGPLGCDRAFAFGVSFSR